MLDELMNEHLSESCINGRRDVLGAFFSQEESNLTVSCPGCVSGKI